MKYDMDWLKSQDIDQTERLKYLFFWGHQPRKDGRISKTCFSQWYNGGFSHEDIFYNTAEHWMMAQKAILFQDFYILDQILKCKSPGEAKKLGRQVKNFENEIWNQSRYQIVKQGNYLKFKQNPSLRVFLETTNQRILVEASPYDKIWGIGMQEKDAGVESPFNWKGLNLLGFALMEVRDELDEESI